MPKDPQCGHRGVVHHEQVAGKKEVDHVSERPVDDCLFGEGNVEELGRASVGKRFLRDSVLGQDVVEGFVTGF
jgi:hypothetical protein